MSKLLPEQQEYFDRITYRVEILELKAELYELLMSWALTKSSTTKARYAYPALKELVVELAGKEVRHDSVDPDF